MIRLFLALICKRKPSVRNIPGDRVVMRIACGEIACGEDCGEYCGEDCVCAYLLVDVIEDRAADCQEQIEREQRQHHDGCHHQYPAE